MSLCTGENRTPEKAIEQLGDALYDQSTKLANALKRIEELESQRDRLLAYAKKIALSNPSETTMKYIMEGCDLICEIEGGR